MEELSPIQRDAYRLVHQDLYKHLDYAEFLAAKVETWSEEDVALARELIPDLVTVIRGIAALHRPPESELNRCRSCHVPWPCTPVITIYELLKDPDRQFVKLVERADYS